MTTTEASTDTTPPIDEERAAAFAEQLFGFYTGGFVTFMIDLGVRTGLLDAIADGPATSVALADRAGLNERYVREWLGAVVTAEIVDYDPATTTYALPAEHAVCLTGDTESNIAPLSLLSGPARQAHRARSYLVPAWWRRPVRGVPPRVHRCDRCDQQRHP